MLMNNDWVMWKKNTKRWRSKHNWHNTEYDDKKKAFLEHSICTVCINCLCEAIIMISMNECCVSCEEESKLHMDANFEMMKDGKYRRRDTLFAINTEVGGEYSVV